MATTFRVDDPAFIINSHRNRASRAVVAQLEPGYVFVHDLDKGYRWLRFDAVTLEAAGEYSKMTGQVPARLAPADDPEAVAIRSSTEALLRSTLHYDEVVECAANLKREATLARFELLSRAVDAWGDDL